MESLAVVRERGLARHVGFSNYPLDACAAALSTGIPEAVEYGLTSSTTATCPSSGRLEAVACALPSGRSPTVCWPRTCPPTPNSARATGDGGAAPAVMRDIGERLLRREAYPANLRVAREHLT